MPFIPTNPAGHHDTFSLFSLLAALVNITGASFFSAPLPYTYHPEFTVKGINRLLMGDTRWILPVALLALTYAGVSSGKKTWGFFRRVAGVILATIGVIGVNGSAIPSGVAQALYQHPAGKLGDFFGSLTDTWLGVLGSQIIYTLIVVLGITLLCGLRWDKYIPAAYTWITHTISRLVRWIVDGIPPIPKDDIADWVNTHIIHRHSPVMEETQLSAIASPEVEPSQIDVPSPSMLSTPSHVDPDSRATIAPVVPPLSAPSTTPAFIPRFRHDPHYTMWEKPQWSDLFGHPRHHDIYDASDSADAITMFCHKHTINATVVDTIVSPSIIRFSLKLGEGATVESLLTKRSTLEYTLATNDVRILAPIRGEQLVGIEIPNPQRHIVTMADCASCTDGRIPIGINTSNKLIKQYIHKFPNIIVAGQTGAGKSSFLNSMLCSLMVSTTPNDTRFILIDPKTVEFSQYQDVPFLAAPVVTTPESAEETLEMLCEEMENRYQMIRLARCRNIEGFNATVSPQGSRLDPARDDMYYPLPRIICVIDELADLMLSKPHGKRIETLIVRLSQKARAAGIHMVLATQRPVVHVVTGLIKANSPARLAFTVASAVDSKVILDHAGAEKLTGFGDGLFVANGARYMERIQSPYMTDEDVDTVVHDVEHRGIAAVRAQKDARIKVKRSSILDRMIRA